MQRDLLKALGQRVRDLRSKQGFSQESFADHCGVHRTFMGAVERGETNISFQNLVKVSMGLDITLAQLLAGVERLAEAIDTAGSDATRTKSGKQ